MTFRRVGFALLLGGAAATATATVSAAVVQSNFVSTDTAPGFAVSGSDLFQTQLASAVRTGAPGSGNAYFYREDDDYTVVLSRLSDGQFGNTGGDPNSSVLPNVVSITFSLNLAVNTQGYSLTRIRTYAGWDTGRDGQAYSIEYSTAGAPDTFQPLATITQYDPDMDDDSSTLVQLTNSSEPLANHVAKLRFNFSGFENGGTAYREFDVVGTPNAVPEPAQFAALGGLVLLAFGAFRKNPVIRA